MSAYLLSLDGVDVFKMIHNLSKNENTFAKHIGNVNVRRSWIASRILSKYAYFQRQKESSITTTMSIINEDILNESFMGNNYNEIEIVKRGSNFIGPPFIHDSSKNMTYSGLSLAHKNDIVSSTFSYKNTSRGVDVEQVCKHSKAFKEFYFSQDYTYINLLMAKYRLPEDWLVTLFWVIKESYIKSVREKVNPPQVNQIGIHAIDAKNDLSIYSKKSHKFQSCQLKALLNVGSKSVALQIDILASQRYISTCVRKN